MVSVLTGVVSPIHILLLHIFSAIYEFLLYSSGCMLTSVELLFVAAIKHYSMFLIQPVSYTSYEYCMNLVYTFVS